MAHRHALRPLLLSFQLVIVLFVVLTLATAAGTFTQHPEFYSSMWFASAIGLLALNNLLCLVVRLSKDRSFWSALIHVSVLLVLAGGLAKAHWKEEGMVNLLVGQVGTVMMETEMGRPTGHQKELPFPLRLDDFVVEFYEEKEQVHVYDLSASHEKPAALLDVEAKEPVTVGGKSVRILGKTTQQFQPAPNHPPIDIEGFELEVDGKKVMVQADGQGVREGELGFLYHEARGAPKLYKSSVSVLDDKGKVIETKEVVVNDPLIRDGWWVYQSNWGETKNGLYSGLQFVRDPGLPYVFVGMALMIVALIVQLVVPRRRRTS